MDETVKFENWSDIKDLREKKGISLDSLSEKMRLPIEKIEYLEKGDFSDADPIITRLQIKNYAKHLDLNYEEMVKLSGLNAAKTDTPVIPLGENVKIKKTRSYKGRKKAPGKALIYTLIVIGAVVMLFGLNQLAKTMNISSDVFEMTEKQQTALDTQTETLNDSTSFRPVLPQANKTEEVVDIVEQISEQALKLAR